MKIRPKLVILMLFVSLLPILASAFFYLFSLKRIGHGLGDVFRQYLVDDGRRQLQTLVDDYSRIMQRDKRLFELAVSVLATEAQRHLDAPAPKMPFVIERQMLGGMLPDVQVFGIRSTEPGLHGQLTQWGRDVESRSYSDDLKRLASLSHEARMASRYTPDLMLRQIVVLESGLQYSYVRTGEYAAPADPRPLLWYKRTRNLGQLTWTVGDEDPTKPLTLIVSVPLSSTAGEFVGSAAIEVSLKKAFRELYAQALWSGKETISLAQLNREPSESGQQLETVLGVNQGGQWSRPLGKNYLVSEDRPKWDEMLKDIRNGQSGVIMMPYEGLLAFWAYGALSEGDYLPIIIVPYNEMIARAEGAQQFVMASMREGLWLTVFMLAAMSGVSIVLALYRSSRITRPIQNLADAAVRLAEGDFDARVAISSRDELEHLGDLFNGLGPQLFERQRMKQALDLAGEVQAHLLPTTAPVFDTMALYGRSLYCDETGGDYFDFILRHEKRDRLVTVAVGDVSGHGVSAALLMASARGVLRESTALDEVDLRQSLQTLNQYMIRDSSDGEFMTLFLGHLDAENRTLQWNSAGHGPVFWLQYNSMRIQELQPTGPPLGIVEEEVFEPQGPITMDRGDIVLIGTDGIWETSNSSGEMYGTDRLCRLLSDYVDCSAEELYEAIVASVETFRGDQKQGDDMTLVVIKAT